MKEIEQLDYDVVRHSQLESLISEVQEKLDAGWQLVGGLSDGEKVWAQAMVREKSKREG